MKYTEQGAKTGLKAALGLMLVLGGLLGCGEEPPPLAERGQSLSETGAENTSVTEKSSGVIPEYQLNALRKAGGVEAQLNDAEAARRAQLEAMSN